MAQVIFPSSAQWPQAKSAGLAPVTLGLELDTSEAEETYVLSDTPDSTITLVPIDAVTLVVDA